MHKFLGILKQSVKLSWQNIKSNKMRTFLTTLGIIIGVAAVISMITIVNGVIEVVMGEFSSLGTGTLSVNVMGTELKPGLTQKDVDLIEQLENVAGINSSLSMSSAAAYKGEALKNCNIQGVSSYFYVKNKDIVTYGRGISKFDVDNESYVCVINDDIAKTLFVGKNPIGEKITLCGVSFEIIGIEGKNNSLFDAMSNRGKTINGEASIPYSIAKKIMGQNRINYLDVYILDANKTSDVKDSVESILTKSFNGRDDVFSVFSMDSLLDSMNTMMKSMSYMLAGIASIALLVGGIGIMNMMLVSVTERTKEIGLRKAMGATPGRIQLQFLLEAICLSLIGGIIGVILGLLISYVASVLIESAFTLSISAVMLGVGFSTAVGIIFGWAPAKKASRLSPIDALRSE